MKHYFIKYCFLLFITITACRQTVNEGIVMRSSDVKFAGPEESLIYIDKLIDKNTGDAALYLKKAQLLFELEQYQGAKESLLIYKEEEPLDFSATLLDIMIKKQEGNYKEALSIAENLFMNEPKESIEFNEVLSSLYSIEGDFLKAIDHINYCIEKDPSNVEYAYLKGIYYFYFKDTSNAFRYLDYAFANGYKKNESIALYSNLLIDSGKEKKAQEVIEEALRKEPGQFELRAAYAKVLKVNKEFEKSKELTRLLISEREDYPYTYLNLSDIYCKSYQFDSALYFAKKAVKLNSQLNEGYYIIARSYRSFGNIYSALYAYDQILEYDPSDPIAISESQKLRKYISYTNKITQELDSFKRRAQDLPIIEPKFQ